MSIINTNLLNQGLNLFSQLTGKPISKPTQNLIGTLAQGFNFYQQQGNKQQNKEGQKQLLMAMLMNQNKPQSLPPQQTGSILPMPSKQPTLPQQQIQEKQDKDNLMLYGILGAGLLLFLLMRK